MIKLIATKVKPAYARGLHGKKYALYISSISCSLRSGWAEFSAMP